MSILNVDKIQPIGGGSTITVDATDIQASTGTIRASTFSGDVSATGIGVTSLNITGVTTTTQNIRIGADNKYLKLGAGDDLAFVHTGGQSYITNATGHLTSRSASYTWENLAGSTEYFRIASTGKVGINEVNPTEMLHIKAEDNTDSFGGIIVKANNNSVYTKHGWRGLDSNEALRFAISGTEKMRLTNGGKLALGRTSADEMMHITNDDNTDNYGGIKIGANNGSVTVKYGWRGIDGSETLRFAIGGSEKIRIDNNGRLFVNRTAQHASSSERLSVNGMTSIQLNSTTTAGLYIFNEETTTSGNPVQPFIYLHDGSGLRSGLGVQRSTGKTIVSGQFGLSLRTGASGVGGTERVFITSNGKVNIGTGELDQTDRMLNIYGGRARISGITAGNSFEIYASNTSGQSYGILCQAGTGSSDINTALRNTSGVSLFRVRGDGVVFVGSSTVQQGSTSKLEVMGTLNNSYPGYSYPIMVSDDAAYNSSAGPGGGIGFSFKQNSGGAYAQAGGIRGIKENTTDGNYASALTFYTRPNGSGTTERLRISSDGYITAPNNVAFSARGGPADVTNNVIIFATIVFQRGGTNYDTSTGYFTAPVDGIYHFMCNPYRYTDSNDSAILLETSTDGGSNWSAQMEIRNMNDYLSDSGRGWFTLSLSQLIDLNKDDKVRIKAVNRVHTNGVYSRFSGFLVA